MVTNKPFCVGRKSRQTQCSTNVLGNLQIPVDRVLRHTMRGDKVTQTKHNKRGRPVLTEEQKVDRAVLKQKFLETSLEALETIVGIMRHSMDSASRLKASTFILNKVIPEGFMFEEDETNRNITLRIITKDSEEDGLSFAEQEELIRDAEQEDIEDEEEWGNEIYNG